MSPAYIHPSCLCFSLPSFSFFSNPARVKAAQHSKKLDFLRLVFFLGGLFCLQPPPPSPLTAPKPLSVRVCMCVRVCVSE